MDYLESLILIGLRRIIWVRIVLTQAFLAATANYMFQNEIPAIYIKLEEVDGQLKVVPTEISLREVFNCEHRTLEELVFSFESVFAPYQQYSFDDIDSIDLVIKDINGNYLSPLEVKLTVIPTSATSSKPENLWGIRNCCSICNHFLLCTWYVVRLS